MEIILKNKSSKISGGQECRWNKSRRYLPPHPLPLHPNHRLARAQRLQKIANELVQLRDKEKSLMEEQRKLQEEERIKRIHDNKVAVLNKTTKIADLLKVPDNLPENMRKPSMRKQINIRIKLRAEVQKLVFELEVRPREDGDSRTLIENTSLDFLAWSRNHKQWIEQHEKLFERDTKTDIVRKRCHFHDRSLS